MAVSTLEAELIQVIDWFHFGIHLNIPVYELLNIMSVPSQDAAQLRTRMLIRWMELDESPSWATIVAALVKIRMRNLAHRLAETYGE